MIITDKFIFLHYPKTGGSFVTKVLKRVHRKIRYKKMFINAPMCKELMLPNMKRIRGSHIYNVHGTYEQIPEEHRTKPVISCIRNPFDRYVSTYEFRNWREKPLDELNKIKEQFPDYPELSFERYLSFINIFDIRSRAHHDLLKVDIGMITYSFIQFFFKDPRLMIQNLNDAYLDSDVYKKDMPEILFMRTEHLNRDLYDLLLKFGYKEEDISFIIKEEKINVTAHRKADKTWNDYYTSNLIDYVQQKERFIFKLFPEYVIRKNL